MYFPLRPRSFLTILAFALATGCLSSQQIMTEKAPGLFREVALSANRQSDVALVRQGIPSYLMLLDGIIRSNPGNKDLLLAGAQAYAAYASVLEEDEQDRAAHLRETAKNYSLQALELTPPFQDALGKPLDVFQKKLKQVSQKDVPTLFWVGNIWGSWIAGAEGPEAMADLPWVEALFERVLQLDPGYYYGGAHLFMAILLSARPEQFGGDLKKAEEHFQKARDYGKGKFLMTEVYYAQYYARQTLNRALFVNTLKSVLQSPAGTEPDLTLANTLAQRKARKLLEQTDEFF
jgi:tetratricopeptide (TPR) repeat protein